MVGKRFASLAVACFAALLAPGGPRATTVAQETALNLIPEPKQTIRRAGTFALDNRARIILGPGTVDADRQAAVDLQETAAASGAGKLTIGAGDGSETWAIVLADPDRSTEVRDRLKQLKIAFSPEMKAEGYILDITPDRIVIAGSTPAGRYYGAQSLRQIIENDASPPVQCPVLTIRDWPELSLRGVSDDISRGQVSTLGDLKRIVRELARWKMNCYMPYMEDIFELKRYPSIGQGRGRLTQDEVRDLDSYAKRFHVQVIPIFQTLGHYENILLNPEFEHLAEFPGAHTLAIADPEIYDFLKAALAEVADVFSSPYIHVGCDESWDVGRGRTAELVAKEGLHKVHADHYLRVYRIVKDLGRQPIMYGDIPLANPGILPEIPKDINIVDWHYGPDVQWPSVKKFRDTGFPVIVSPGVSNWARLYPDYDRAETNIRTLTAAGHAAGALGAVTSNWGDYGGDNLRELVWYGYVYAAERAWSPGPGDGQTFGNRFFPRFFGVDSPALRRAFTQLVGINEKASFWEFRSPPILDFQGEITASDNLRGRQLENSMKTVIADIQSARPEVKRNDDQLDYWVFSAERAGWVGRRVWMGQILRDMSYEMKTLDTGVQSNLIDFCQRLAADLPELKEKYRSLWLRTNRPEGLDYNLSWYDYQMCLLQEQKRRFEQGNYALEPAIESSWIAFPEVLLPGRPSRFKEAHFRYHFRRPGQARRAFLQVAGDSHVNVYLNGEHLGEMVARPSLSAVVESARVRIFDITDKLTRGDNVIAVSVKNYDLQRPGANVYAECQLTSGEIIKITSGGPGWLTNVEPEESWQSTRFNDRGWRPAEAYTFRDNRGRDFALSRPALEDGVPSRYVRLSQ